MAEILWHRQDGVDEEDGFWVKTVESLTGKKVLEIKAGRVGEKIRLEYVLADGDGEQSMFGFDVPGN